MAPPAGTQVDDAIVRFPYLGDLNPAQRQAVEAMDGAVLVLAGAGTGKTRVLTTRLAHILMTRRARPQELLAVTFTNKAAREMKDRVGHLIGHVSEGWWIGTFHHVGARILRRHAELVGLKSGFTILTPDDQQRLIKQLLQAAAIDDKKWPARMLATVFDGWKDRALTPDKLKPADGGEIANGRAVALYQQYQERLAVLNACDFGDLLLHCVTIFQRHADVLASWQGRFKYILVDEYQDTNVCQYLWLRLLAQTHRNLCVVGDDDQSIYGWRGAEVGNILRFETDYPGATVVRLEQNYRSKGHILAAASAVIARNTERLGKELWTEDDMGDPVRVVALWDDDTEARDIGDRIEALQRDNHALGGIAVLVRAGYLTRRIEERLNTIAVPYRVVGGVRFYERLEIRDAVAYLRLIHTPSDDLAFERIYNKPKRGLGTAALQTLMAAARGLGVSLYEAAQRLIETDEMKPAARRKLADLVQSIERWRGLAASDTDPVTLAETVLDESGYAAMWKDEYDKNHTPDAAGRLENLKELVSAMAEFLSLEEFLDHVSLVMDVNEADSGEDKVSLMTLHAAKGLEFDTVFLPGWEEGLFPNQRAMDDNGPTGLEEERRLAYVGLTRARRRAIISHCANRRRPDQRWDAALPSRFIAELPDRHVEHDGEAGLGHGARAGGVAYGRENTMFDRGRAARFAAQGRGFRGTHVPDGGPVIDGRATRIESQTGPSPMAAGDRVFHRKFGYGTVITAEGDKLLIAFDASGDKRVMAGFVMPADQAD